MTRHWTRMVISRSIATIGAALLLGLGVTTLSTGAAAQKYTMKIGTATINDTQYEWMKRFKARIEKRSGGQISVKLFPSSQLGAIPRMIEGLQLGTVEGLVTPSLFLVGVDRRNSVLAVPGIFDNIDHCWKTVWDEQFRTTMFPLMKDKGILAISILCTAPQAFLTKKTINKLDDFKGLKIRVLASDLEIKPMQAVGINPTPMPFGAVLPGLQRGLIDGVSSIPILFGKLKMYNVAKNITMTRLVYFGVPVYVSKIWFDKLPANLQKMILEESLAVEKGLVDWNNKANADTLAAWKKNGGTVGTLPAADQTKLVKTANAAAEKVLESQPDVNALYKKLRPIIDRHR